MGKKVYDNSGNHVGYEYDDGQIKDLGGNYVGRRGDDGAFYDARGNHAGYVGSQGEVYNSRGEYAGRQGVPFDMRGNNSDSMSYKPSSEPNPAESYERAKSNMAGIVAILSIPGVIGLIVACLACGLLLGIMYLGVLYGEVIYNPFRYKELYIILGGFVALTVEYIYEKISMAKRGKKRTSSLLTVGGCLALFLGFFMYLNFTLGFIGIWAFPLDFMAGDMRPELLSGLGNLPAVENVYKAFIDFKLSLPVVGVDDGVYPFFSQNLAIWFGGMHPILGGICSFFSVILIVILMVLWILLSFVLPILLPIFAVFVFIIFMAKLLRL